MWVLVVRESREKSEFEIQKSSLMIQKSKCVQLCRVYRKPNIWSPPGWIPKKSPNYHYLPMRVMFNSKFQARPSCCCQFQKVFEFFSWNQINLFHEKFHGLLWNFDVTTTTFKFWKCAESCVSILWLKNSNYPLLATSRGRCLLATSKKNSKFKNLHTQNRKNPRNCYYHNLLSPVGLVIFVSSESKFLSYIIIQSCDLYYKIIIFYLGFKKTGCRRRNVLKEDLVAEDLNPGVGELFWARLPGYGQKKPEVPMGAWVSNGLDYYGNLV